MAGIEDGKIVDERVTSKLYASLENGVMGSVNSIVLHRTDSSTAKGTLDAYAGGKKAGAHFLIDKDGTLYQTARVDRICWHVGILLPRCQVEKGCDPKELKTITALLYEKGLSFGTRARNVSRHEVKKSYPLRYPSNNDSIGIEVVGRFSPLNKSFETPTLLQFKSVKWLVDLLVKAFKISLQNDVYAHGAIARKQVSEGAQLLQYLFSGVVS